MLGGRGWGGGGGFRTEKKAKNGQNQVFQK